MMQPVPMNTHTQKQPWKDAAMKKAECITDVWEVGKAYAGRAAEWVLFLCMIVNIVEMLPGVSIPVFIMNLVLGIQVVMLDIGGMSLSGMAAHAKEQGDEAAARKAGTTSRFLIGLMILTLLLVSVGVLFPAMKQYTDMAEKGLILVRVVMTVIYGHVLHSLRSSNRQAVPPPPALQPAVPSSTELETLIRDILVPVLEQYNAEAKADIAEQVRRMLAAMNKTAPEECRNVSAHGAQDKEAMRQPPTPLSARRRQRDISPRTHGDEPQSNREDRIASAYRELLQESIRPTGDSLSRRARCNRAAALKWLKTKELAG